jgi:hypothetical protein
LKNMTIKQCETILSSFKVQCFRIKCEIDLLQTDFEDITKVLKFACSQLNEAKAEKAEAKLNKLKSSKKCQKK